MTADVCLLLLQSLNGDCKTTVPIVASLDSSIEHQKIEDSPTSGDVSAAIAPIKSSMKPQFGLSTFGLSTFGLSNFCESLNFRHLLTCFASTFRADSQTERKGTRLAILLPGVNALSVSTAAPVARPISRVMVPMASQIPSPEQLTSISGVRTPQFSPGVRDRRPASGAQLYRQRELSLQSGRLYTRLAPDQFAEAWSQATEQPTYQDWLALLAREAQAAGVGQGNNRLEVVLGDSLGMWLPSEELPRDRLWLNQGISGDTTGGILQRLSAFAPTRPTTIHLLAGVNDLKNGVPEAEIVDNLRLILQQLRQQHPQAEIVLYSVFPTRWEAIPNSRVRSLNAQIARLAQQGGVDYRNVYRQFQDRQGALRVEFTTDGLHLNPRGYRVWRRAMLASAG